MQENLTLNTSNIAINSNMISLETAEKSLNTMGKMLEHMRSLTLARGQKFERLVEEFDSICAQKEEVANSVPNQDSEKALPRQAFYKLLEEFDIIMDNIMTAGEICSTDKNC
ncbi:MAG: hypothetical protein K0R02_520 [Rickettsiaceae bacterium]|jgi:hypothetical protein|nr:hypothetical protein [Rickettsiaceae bacterium]